MKPFTIILSIILLITATADLGLGIGYYQILRLTVTIGAVIWALQFNNKNQNLFITFCIIAIFFNPIAPIYLDRGLWQIIDFITAIIFILPLIKKI